MIQVEEGIHLLAVRAVKRPTGCPRVPQTFFKFALRDGEITIFELS